MKYKIWDRVNKRYANNMTISPDGIMLCNNVNIFDIRDDFEVQWVKEPGDDLVDPKIWEDFKEAEKFNQLKEETKSILESLAMFKGYVSFMQDKLIGIIDEK